MSALTKAGLKLPFSPTMQKETTRLLTRAFQQVRINGFLPTDEIRSHVRQTVDFLLHNRHAISLLADIHENDDETYVHSANTMFMAAAFAIRHQMEDAECFRWALAALLHDVGKTRIPEHILKKPGPLDLLEWEVMHQHPIYGFQILRKSPDPEIHGLAAQVAVEHHERLNGSGYPHHLGLDAVHPVSRSLMVLDIYEALTGHRVYRARSSPRKVIHYLMNDYSDRVSVPVILELASMVGIFPVGTFVENEDGEILMIQKYEDAENYRGEMTVLKIFGPGKKILPRPQNKEDSQPRPDDHSPDIRLPRCWSDPGTMGVSDGGRSSRNYLTFLTVTSQYPSFFSVPTCTCPTF
ncbi:MAG: probable metal-dependent phosphohydrolase [Leptospirillum rubarum]|nr:MAG: probable metal-dependent phosphohydrolase [Leptospirillum rubarum]